MTNEPLAGWTKSAETAYKSLMDLVKINSTVTTKSYARQRELVESYIEAGVEQFDVATKSAGYKEWVANQADFARANGERLSACAKDLSVTVGEAKQAYLSWLEHGVENFRGNVAA